MPQVSGQDGNVTRERATFLVLGHFEFSQQGFNANGAGAKEPVFKGSVGMTKELAEKHLFRK